MSTPFHRTQDLAPLAPRHCILNDYTYYQPRHEIQRKNRNNGREIEAAHRRDKPTEEAQIGLAKRLKHHADIVHQATLADREPREQDIDDDEHLVEIDERNEIIIKMAERGIACNVHYKPLPMMTAYKNLGFDIANYPNAYNQYRNEITLPLHTRLSDEEIEYVLANFINLISK